MTTDEPALGEMVIRQRGRRFERAVSVASDPYLRDHLVDGMPVFPAAYHLALMMQAALRCWSRASVPAVQEVRFVQPARFRCDEPLHFVVDVEEQPSVPGSTNVSISSSMAPPRPGFPPIVRDHAQGRVFMRPPFDSKARFRLLDFSSASDYAELYERPAEIRHGPAFLAGLRYHHPRPDLLLSLVAPPRRSTGPWWPGREAAPATLLNAILHVGFSLAVLSESRTVLPIAIESGELYRVPVGLVQVLARRTGRDGDVQRIHVAAWDEQGRHVAVFRGFTLQARG